MEFYQELKQKFSNISFDEILAEHAIVGDPDFAADKISWIRKHTGLQNFMGWTRIGDLHPDLVCKSLRMFSDHVAPRVQLNASRGVPSSFIPATPAG